jgi:hypothetical protein
MTSSYTTALRLEKPAAGDYSGAWAPVANTQFDLIDAAIASMTSVSTTGGSTTLTTNSGSSDQARAPILKVTGTLVSNATIVIPNQARTFFVTNETSGAYTLSIKTASGSSLTVTQGYACWLRCDGSNAVTYASPQIVASTGLAASLSAAQVAALAFGPFTAIASATTTDLSTVATVGVSITGTTTITGFGTGANLLRIGKFTGILTLTHNGTSLILPGAANITTAAGDRFIALSDGSGNWTVVSYDKADGTPLALADGSVATAKIAGSAVTYAKIQNVSATDRLLGRSTAGAGNVEEIACTSFARSLLDDSNQTEAKLTLGITAPGVVLLTSGTISSAATLDIVLTSYTSYRKIVVELVNMIPATDNVEFWARCSTNGGSTYDAGASNYWFTTQRFANDGGTAQYGTQSSGATAMVIGVAVGSGAAEGISTTFEIPGQTNTAIKPKFSWTSVTYYFNDFLESQIGVGLRTTAQDTDAIRFMFASGNIASGTYAVYGLS